MINPRVLIGFGVTLVALWSTGPVLAGGQPGHSGWTQTGGQSALQADESLMASDYDADADLAALDVRPGRGVRQRAMEEQEDADQESIAGRLHDYFTTRVAGEPNLHVLAKIDTPRGTATVDLGPVHQVPQIQPGQSVRLRGFWGQVNNRNVFVTTRLSDGQRTVRVFAGPQRQNVRQISGDVLGSYTITSDQTGQQMRIARIRTDDGRVRVVNLGPASETASLDLERGDEITAVGRPIGMRRFRASEVSANGQTAAIDWSALAQGRFGQRLQQAGFQED